MNVAGREEEDENEQILDIQKFQEEEGWSWQREYGALQKIIA